MIDKKFRYPRKLFGPDDQLRRSVDDLLRWVAEALGEELVEGVHYDRTHRRTPAPFDSIDREVLANSHVSTIRFVWQGHSAAYRDLIFGGEIERSRERLARNAARYRAPEGMFS